jgi:hypothetical protein
LDSGVKEEEVIGFKNQYDDITNHIHSESTILDFILCFLFKVIQSMSLDRIQPSIKYEVLCCANFLSIETIRTALSSIDTRRTLYQNGIDAAIKYLTPSEEQSDATVLPEVECCASVGCALKDGVEELN